MNSKRGIDDIKNVGSSKTIGYLSVQEFKKQSNLDSVYRIKKDNFLKSHPEYKSLITKDCSLEEFLILLTSEGTIRKVYLGALVTEPEEKIGDDRKFNIWAINGGQKLGEHIPLNSIYDFALQRGIRGGLTDVMGGAIYFYHTPSLDYALQQKKSLLESYNIPTDPEKFIDHIAMINYKKHKYPEVYKFISDIFTEKYLVEYAKNSIPKKNINLR